MMTKEPIATGAAAVKAADLVVADLVASATKGRDPARVTNAPAGAGKTGAVLKLVGSLHAASARVGVITQTNEQAFDLVRRLAAEHRAVPIAFMPASSVVVPEDVLALPNVRCIKAAEAGAVPVVIATADKWAYARKDLLAGAFDAGIVDEAYQMTSAKLYRVADYFKSLDLIGDPGQLDPFTTVDDSVWAGLRGNPVMNAVDALLAHHPKTPPRALPVTRRLPHSAADIVRRAFYPRLDFGAATLPEQRRLELSAPPSRSKKAWANRALDGAADHGWAYVELPERPSLPLDREIVDALASLASQLFARNAHVFDERTGEKGRKLDPSRIAIGVAHRNQRAAVTIALQERGLGSVVVDTANRLQGREFDVVLVWHPLAGRTDATAFHLDAGRLCVLATRHRQACIVVGRAGTARLLDEHPPPGNVVLGVSNDPEFDGWEAHVTLLEHLEQVRVGNS